MTTKNKIQTKILAFLSLLTGCTNQSSKDLSSQNLSKEGLITFHLNAPPSKVEPLLLSEIADSVSYVALETTKETLTKDGVQYGDRYYTVVNKRILCFDRNGKFLHQVGKCGNGPEEYIWSRDDYKKISVDISTNWVYCRSIDGKAQIYDQDGIFVKSLTENDYNHYISMVYNYHVSCITSDSTYVIDTHTNKKVWLNRISNELREERKEILNKYRNMKKQGFSTYGMSQVIYSSDKAWYLWDAFRSDTVYMANNTEFKPFCLIAPQNKFKFEDQFDETFKSIPHQPLIQSMYILNNRILLHVIYFTSISFQESYNDYWVFCELNDKSVTYHSNYIVNDLDGGPNIKSSDDIYCLSVEDLKNDKEIYNSYFIDGVKAKLKDQEGKFQRLLEQLADDANPIIRTIHWKE